MDWRIHRSSQHKPANVGSGSPALPIVSKEQRRSRAEHRKQRHITRNEWTQFLFAHVAKIGPPPRPQMSAESLSPRTNGIIVTQRIATDERRGLTKTLPFPQSRGPEVRSWEMAGAYNHQVTV
jgi:hypothetical protein